jgi:hypothetical protein
MNPDPSRGSPDAVRAADGAVRAYRRRQCWLAAILAIQLVGGLAALAAPGQEIFPLFSWFLFPLTPQSPRTQAELQLMEYRGQRLDPPLPLATVREAVPAAQAPIVFELGQKLALALAVGDAAAVERLRHTLESALNPGPGRYRLAEVTYDPIERYRTGAVLQVRPMREFQIGPP